MHIITKGDRIAFYLSFGDFSIKEKNEVQLTTEMEDRLSYAK
jgi:hypothetical protein